MQLQSGAEQLLAIEARFDDALAPWAHEIADHPLRGELLGFPRIFFRALVEAEATIAFVNERQRALSSAGNVSDDVRNGLRHDLDSVHHFRTTSRAFQAGGVEALRLMPGQFTGLERIDLAILAHRGMLEHVGDSPDALLELESHIQTAEGIARVVFLDTQR